MKTIDIIGAGIGGLTLAIALKQKGFAVRVFEQAPELKAVGAGINLACNAMQVYDSLGLRTAIEEAGHLCFRMQVTNAQLASLSEIDIQTFTERYAVHNVAIHRAALQRVLRSYLTDDEVFLGKQLLEIDDWGNVLRLHFSDGTQFGSQCVIGADGIGSTVRTQWIKDGSIRSSEQVCWRGIAPFQLPKPYWDQLTEAWGPQGRFGFVQVDAEHVYWFAVRRTAAVPEPADKAYLLAAYQDFHPLVGQLLQATPAEVIHEAPLGDLIAPACWYRDSVCLMGDAAHATTPNLGQGACQAIEDAWVLAHCLGQEEACEKAFQQFQSIRQRKVKQIVKTSWTVGQMAHWENPFAIRLRNGLMRMMPKSMGERQSESIYTLEELSTDL